MSDLNYELKLPLVVGDNAAEIEQEIKDRAFEFFGSDAELAFPTGYTAKPQAATDTHATEKAYVVRDVTVKRRGEAYWAWLQRSVSLPPVRGGNAAEIQAEIDRLVGEFFGPDPDVNIYGRGEAVLEVSGTDGKSESGGHVYRVEYVTVQQRGRWSTD